MDTRKPRKFNSIIRIKNINYQDNNMLTSKVIENYMHIEHRHTKGMGCLKQHNTGSKQHIYVYFALI